MGNTDMSLFCQRRGYTQTCPQFGALTRTSGVHPDAKICCQLRGPLLPAGHGCGGNSKMVDMFCIFSWGDRFLHPSIQCMGWTWGFFFNVLSTLEQNIMVLLVELCLMDRLNQVTQSPTFHRSRRSQGSSRGSSI